MAMVLVGLSFVLKLTGYKTRHLIAAALFFALFVGLSWRLAIEQSRSALEAWLSDSSLLLDVAVVMTVDVVLQMAYCVLAVQLMTSGKVKKRTLFAYRALRLFPGLLIFIVLFWLLVSCIYALPGVSFSLISWLMAAAVSVLIPLLVFLVRKLLPEKEIRLELLFLSNALTAVLGVIATVNGSTARESVDPVNFPALAAVCVLFVAGALAGYIIYRIKSKKHS